MVSQSEQNINHAFKRQTDEFTSLVGNLLDEWPDEKQLIARRFYEFKSNIEQYARAALHGNSTQEMHEPSSTMADPMYLSILLDALRASPGTSFPICSDAYSDPIGDVSAPSISPGNEGSVCNFVLDEFITETSFARSGPENVTDRIWAASEGLNLQAAADTISPALLQRGVGDQCLAKNASSSNYTGGTLPLAMTSNQLTQLQAEMVTQTLSLVPLLRSDSFNQSYHSSYKRPRLQAAPTSPTDQTLSQSLQTPPRLISKDREQTAIVRKIRKAILSSNAMLQLRSLSRNMRKTSNWMWDGKDHQFGSLVRALEILDKQQNCMSVWQHLLSERYFDHWETQLSIARRQRQDVSTGILCSKGKPETVAWDALMQEAYPETVKRTTNGDRTAWDKQRKSLHNRRIAAKNWWKAGQKFGRGVILMIPTGGQSQVTDHEFQTLRKKDCETLLDVLAEANDGYVRKVAEKLTPFVQAMYEGREYKPRFKLESCDEAELMTTDICKRLDLFDEEVVDGEGIDSSMTEWTYHADDHMI